MSRAQDIAERNRLEREALRLSNELRAVREQIQVLNARIMDAVDTPRETRAFGGKSGSSGFGGK